jgi:hypothetical protein
MRRLILDRDMGRCAWCGRPFGDALNIHHRVLRSQGGIGSPANGISLCGSGTTGCHGDAHHNRRWAEETGLIVPSWQSPDEAPVTTWRGRYLLLDTEPWVRRLDASAAGGPPDGPGGPWTPPPTH